MKIRTAQSAKNYLPQTAFDLILSCMLSSDALSLPFSSSAWILLFSHKI